MPDMTAIQHPWAVVMPVKRLEIAKTRLGLDAAARADLALAMALDTASGCLAAANVALLVVVSDDPRAASALSAVGAIVVADEPDSGLNPALVHGARAAAEIAPRAGIATIASDLPSLQSRELAAVLDLARNHTAAVVADAVGVGTTVLASQVAAQFRPEFGPESLARHVAAGATDLTRLAGLSLRRDVDTVDDLQAALGFGCGRHTAALAARLGLAAPAEP
jgi:2-phospho-L-lactate guanylyltransferase